jgi:hypothetical protein
MNHADPKNGYKSKHILGPYAEDEDDDPKFYPFYPNNYEAGSSHLPEKGSFPVAPEAISRPTLTTPMRRITPYLT